MTRVPANSVLDSGYLCDLRKGDQPDPMTRICDRPAVLRYRAMGGGYMFLCEGHGDKHRGYCERWDGVKWLQP